MTWQEGLAKRISEEARMRGCHNLTPIVKQAVLTVLSSLKLPERPSLNVGEGSEYLRETWEHEGMIKMHDLFTKAFQKKEEKVDDGLDEVWAEYDRRNEKTYYASADQWRFAMKQAIRKWAGTPKPDSKQESSLLKGSMAYCNDCAYRHEQMVLDNPVSLPTGCECLCHLKGKQDMIECEHCFCLSDSVIENSIGTNAIFIPHKKCCMCGTRIRVTEGTFQ